uniref:protein shisa-4-like n=1 Tax=Myxine glutinosa TaxID=7769 RepID=UPI00358E4643
MRIYLCLLLLILISFGWTPTRATESCLWYRNLNGIDIPTRSCGRLEFCCGTCHQRYCCTTHARRIKWITQRACNSSGLSLPMLAGVVVSILSFIVALIVIGCCCCCPACCLFRVCRDKPTKKTAPPDAVSVAISEEKTAAETEEADPQTSKPVPDADPPPQVSTQGPEE